MYVTPEAINAEIAYRYERARAAALGEQLRRSRRQRPSLVRRWLTSSGRQPVHHTRPAIS
jgi:hypothetical protein